MKNKKLKLRIERHGDHWYIFTNGKKGDTGWNYYINARTYALRRAYAKNIRTID